MHTFRTDFAFSLVPYGPEHTVELVIRFTVRPGCEPTQEQPGEGPSVEIADAHIVTGHGTIYRKTEIIPNWLWSFIEGDEELHGDMLAAASDQDAYAADQAADAKREDQMLERHQ